MLEKPKIDEYTDRNKRKNIVEKDEPFSLRRSDRITKQQKQKPYPTKWGRRYGPHDADTIALNQKPNYVGYYWQWGRF